MEALEQQLAKLKDPNHVKAQARERLHFVMPGEIAYVVIRPSAAPAAPGAAALPGTVASGPEAPWYSQMWSSVRVADKEPAKR